MFGIVLLMILPWTSALEVSMQILDDYKTVKSGEDVKFQVILKNIQETGRRDIALTYDLFKEDSLLTTVKELKAVETQTSFIAYMTLPKDISPGVYRVRVSVNNTVGAENSFSVVPTRTPLLTFQYYSLLLLIALLFIASMILWEVRKMYKLQRASELSSKH